MILRRPGCPPSRSLPPLAALLFVLLSSLVPERPARAAEHWVPLGPEGGSILSLVADPQAGSTVYAGTDGGGVWKSSDSGAHWQDSTAGLGNVAVRALAIDPRSSRTLYAGTDFGVYKSVDGGASWTVKNSGLATSLVEVTQVALDPKQPKVVYAGYLSGLLKSVDGGETWRKLATPFSSTALLALDPGRPATLYVAGTSNVLPGSVFLFKSPDGGATWAPTHTLPLRAGLLSLTVGAGSPGVIYAAVASLTAGQPVLFRSRDGGASWSQVGQGLEGRIVNTLAVSPRTAAVYAGSRETVFRSTDGGATFAPTPVNGWVLSLALSPGTRGRDAVYAGDLDLGVYQSPDGGLSWRAAHGGLLATRVTGLASGGSPAIRYGASPGGQVWSAPSGAGFAAVSRLPLPLPFFEPFHGALAVDPTAPATVYAGIEGIVARSINGGNLWRRKLQGETDVRLLLVDPQNPRAIYAAGRPIALHPTGCETLKSLDRGETWSCLRVFFFDLVLAASPVSPTSPTVLYGAAIGVSKSTDGGATWTDASTGLSASEVFHLAPAPSAAGTLYAGLLESDGSEAIARTDDGGASWSRVAAQGLPLANPYSLDSLAVDPDDPETVYAVDRFLGTALTPARVRVYRSTDGGATWQLLSDGLPRVGSTSRLVLDPREPGSVFLGTRGRGIYRLVP